MVVVRVVYGVGGGKLVVEDGLAEDAGAGDGRAVLVLTLVRGVRALEERFGAARLLEELLGLAAESGVVLARPVCTAHGWDGCVEYEWLPRLDLIASLLRPLAEVLRKAPREICADTDPRTGECTYWAWSPQQARATAKAAILLDIAAMILRKPEMVEKLPGDASLLQLLQAASEQPSDGSQPKPHQQPESEAEKAVVEG